MMVRWGWEHRRTPPENTPPWNDSTHTQPSVSLPGFEAFRSVWGFEGEPLGAQSRASPNRLGAAGKEEEQSWNAATAEVRWRWSAGKGVPLWMPLAEGGIAPWLKPCCWFFFSEKVAREFITFMIHPLKLWIQAAPNHPILLQLMQTTCFLTKQNKICSFLLLLLINTFLIYCTETEEVKLN